MKHIKWISLFTLVLLLTIGCEEEPANTPESLSEEFVKISYGTSFGECIGYCHHQIVLTDTNITYTSSGYDFEMPLAGIFITTNYNKKYWKVFENKIDFAKILELDDVIGCPDCADGGAEWVEIKSDSTVKKVTFEYGNEPDVFKPFIKYLRTYTEAFTDINQENINFNEKVLINQPGTIQNYACSRGCYQFLVEIDQGKNNILYNDKYLSKFLQKDGTGFTFCGVIKDDSTQIYKPLPNDVPGPDFKVRNLRIIDFAITDDSTFKLDTVTAEIKDYGDFSVDGCGWIMIINEKEYSPKNLPVSFLQDGLKVKVSYILLNDKFVCDSEPDPFDKIEILYIE